MDASRPSANRGATQLSMQEENQPFFRERELILRSDGKVRFIRLTRTLQIGLTVFVGVVAIWGLVMTTATIVQDDVIDSKNVEIQEARIAYESLFEEVLSYQKKLAGVTSTIRASQGKLLSQIAELNVASDEDVRKLFGDPDGLGQQALDTSDAKARGDVEEHLTKLDSSFKEIADTNSLLEGSLRKIKAEFRLAETARAQIITTRRRLREQVASLESELEQTKSRASRLSEQVEQLSINLDKAEDHRSEVQQASLALKARVAELDTGRRNADKRAAAAEEYLREVLDKLAVATGSSTKEIDTTPAGLRVTTVSLIDRLSQLQSGHENVLERLGERTASTIEESEKLIEMTGLKLDVLMARADEDLSGQGGPFIEAVDGGGLAFVVADVDKRLRRWESLRMVLRSLPIISPVDFYHLASGFGLRRDPITGKRAMHYGLDMAGWRNAPVFSSAPGTVVFAGRKGRYGKMIEIDHGLGIRTRYAHLNKVLVQVGDEVGHRHKIGLLGSSGRSTGPHVHFEVRFDGKPLNPSKFIKAGKHVFKG